MPWPRRLGSDRVVSVDARVAHEQHRRDPRHGVEDHQDTDVDGDAARLRVSKTA